jgi:hypothetical protein
MIRIDTTVELRDGVVVVYFQTVDQISEGSILLLFALSGSQTLPRSKILQLLQSNQVQRCRQSPFQANMFGFLLFFLLLLFDEITDTFAYQSCTTTLERKHLPGKIRQLHLSNILIKRAGRLLFSIVHIYNSIKQRKRPYG